VKRTHAPAAGLGVELAAFVVIGTRSLVLAESPDATPPGFTDVDPLPADVRSDGAAIQTEISARVVDWSAQFGTTRMSEVELTSGMFELWDAMTDVAGGTPDPRWEDIPAADGWLAFNELGARMDVLCRRLPPGHELLMEFC
jgi:hypothetical protein